MFKYETHLHTAPVSRCGKVSVFDNLKFYKDIGYDGVFITNHFIGGSFNYDVSKPYKEVVEFYFSDYEEAQKIGKEIGIQVFCGVEHTFEGADFLIYGLGKEWYLENEQIPAMKASEFLSFARESGAFIVQAHPFREARYIDHIHLFPRHVDAVEVINASHECLEDEMAKKYAEHYGLIPFAGSDNHHGAEKPRLAGLCFKTPVKDETDFINKIKKGEAELFLTIR